MKSLGTGGSVVALCYIATMASVPRVLGSGAAHWAFRPITRPTLPELRHGWPRNAIDAFALKRLQEANTAPSPTADRVTLLRRVSLDLTGLPPTPEEVADFLADSAPDAFERLVDRLLASPRFGERQARHWLDAARYADSEGYESDPHRPIWKYRDWVIDAFNADMPYDRFVVDQIAGDLLPEATRSQRVATGIHRNSMGPSNHEPTRLQGVIDRTNTVATVFLGLTMGCAQCHNHKLEPISQREYYRFFAFFNDSDDPTLEFATPAEVERRDANRSEQERARKALADHDGKLAGELDGWLASLTPEVVSTLSPEIRKLVAVPPAERTNPQTTALLDVLRTRDPGHRQRQARLDSLVRAEPKFVSTLVVNHQTSPRQTTIFIRGEFDSPGEAVTPGTPAALPPLAIIENGTARTRLDLAHWIVAPANPLAARVVVNRMWQHLFGLGLVETENNFGTRTARPAHAALLDWLASDLRTGGWSRKRLQRTVLNSATYRQSSRVSPHLARSDPRNRLLARAVRLRLEAEIIRDQALAVAGLLSTRIGGAGVFPYQVDGVMDGRADKSKWVMSPGENSRRRGLYVHFWRLTPHPVLGLLDAPDAVESCTRRSRSNTPLQALVLLNHPWFVECARALALRVLREAPPDDAARVDHAFRLCMARLPTDGERRVLRRLVDEQRAAMAMTPARAATIAGRAKTRKDVSEAATWTALARALLNLDEFITRE